MAMTKSMPDMFSSRGKQKVSKSDVQSLKVQSANKSYTADSNTPVYLDRAVKISPSNSRLLSAYACRRLKKKWHVNSTQELPVSVESAMEKAIKWVALVGSH